jgi:hypothetical protein
MMQRIFLRRRSRPIENALLSVLEVLFGRACRRRAVSDYPNILLYLTNIEVSFLANESNLIQIVIIDQPFKL